MEQEEANKRTYTVDDIQILEGIEAIRFRPGMYVGATDYRALPVLVEYMVDGLSYVYASLEQTPGQMTIRFEQDGSATMICGGPTQDEAFLEQCAPRLLQECTTMGGCICMATLSALSERLSVTVRTPRGQWRTMLFERGHLRGDESHSSSPDPNCDVWLRFWPDLTILEPAAFDLQLIRERLDRLFPHMSHMITLVDARA